MRLLRFVIAIVICLFLTSVGGDAQRWRSWSYGASSPTYRSSKPKRRPKTSSRPKRVRTPRISRQRCATCQRDSRGRIKRSAKAKNAFARSRPCPASGKKKASCRGYRIDHIVPLACGGSDNPSNMQWLTTEQWKQKSKWERKGCQ